MQQLTVRWSWLLVVCLSVHEGEGFSLRAAGKLRTIDFASSSEWAACQQATVDDVSFWTSEWNTTESKLTRLQQAAAAQRPKGTVAGLQVSVGAAQQTRAMGDMEMDPAELAPTLALVNGMYDYSKQRIAELNKREAKSKSSFSEKQTAFTARVDEIDGELAKDSEREEKNHLLGEANFFEDYWKRVRERNRKQFHTSLNIQHGLMQKLKMMSDMYGKAMSGDTSDAAGVKQELGLAAPQVVLLQGAWQGMASFVQEALVEVHSERSELAQWVDPVPANWPRLK